MENLVTELQNATDFVRELFAEREIVLNFSTESVRHLDTLFGQEFSKGEPVNKNSIFSQYQCLILMGISGYLTQVILRNTQNVHISFEGNDSGSNINYTLEKEAGYKFKPGHEVLKRCCSDNGDFLYTYVAGVIKYFNETENSNGYHKLKLTHLPLTDTQKEKHWWRLW